MRPMLKRLGWAAGIVAGASLCIAMRGRRGTPVKPGSIRPLPSQRGAYPARRRPNSDPRREFPSADDTQCRGSASSELAFGAAGPAESNGVSAVSFEIVDVPRCRPRGLLGGTITNWIVAFAILAIAFACVYDSVTLRNRQTPPNRNAFDSTRAATPHSEPRDGERPWVGLLQTVAQPLTPTGGGSTIPARALLSRFVSATSFASRTAPCSRRFCRSTPLLHWLSGS